MWNSAFADRYTIHCHFADTVVMYKCRCYNEHVENLVRLKLSWGEKEAEKIELCQFLLLRLYDDLQLNKNLPINRIFPGTIVLVHVMHKILLREYTIILKVTEKRYHQYDCDSKGLSCLIFFR